MSSAGHRIHITHDALADLRGIFDYIQQHSPANAAAMIERILDSMDKLDVFPSRHKVVGKSRATGTAVHSMVVRPYIVYYRVEASPPTVFILAVQHGSRRQPVRFP